MGSRRRFSVTSDRLRACDAGLYGDPGTSPWIDEHVVRMSPAEWWGSRDAFPGGSQVPGSSSAVTAGSVSRGVWSLAIEASEK